MKTRKIILFSVANLIALFIIWAVAERVTQKNRFGSRFKPRSFIMSDTVDCNSSAQDAFRFYIHHYDEIYHKTSSKHHEYRLLNSDSITSGTEIFCREGEEGEMVFHHYVVKELIQGRLVYKSSEPSRIEFETARGVMHKECNSFVYIDFLDVSEKSSRIAFTIIIQMPAYIYKLAGRIAGGKKARKEWESHLTEELTSFAGYCNKNSNSSNNE